MQSRFVMIAGVMGALGVVTGAFGAHGLKSIVSPEMLETWEVGVRYHLYHVLAILALAAGPCKLWNCRWTLIACWSWLIGTLLFSGSLYLLTLTGATWLGPITPLGGLVMILGWVAIVPAARRLKD